MNDRVDRLEAELIELKAALAENGRRTRRLSAINLLLAVAVLAFGGTSAAYALAAANTVNSASIIDESVKHADIKPNTIGSSRFLDNSIVGTKIADNSIAGADVNESTLVLTCPDGMSRVRDVCHSGGNSPKPWLQAVNHCKTQGLRLPTTFENVLISHDLQEYVSYFWTESVYHNGTVLIGVTGNGNGAGGDLTAKANDIDTTRGFFCVTTVGARP